MFVIGVPLIYASPKKFTLLLLQVPPAKLKSYRIDILLEKSIIYRNRNIKYIYTWQAPFRPVRVISILNNHTSNTTCINDV